MNAFIQILLNPAIISLCAGLIIGLSSSLSLPKWLTDFTSIYLIFTIGYKGGACLGVANACTPPLLALACVGIILGLFQPFLHYFILKKTTSLDTQTASVVAAEYGSISVVTFITAVTFLNDQGISHDTFMSAIAGIMEIPALFSGIWLLQHNNQKASLMRSFIQITRSILSSIKICAIFVGFAVGAIVSWYLPDTISTAIIWPFTLMLILFMIDIGIKIAKQKKALSEFKLSLIAFGIYVPLINGCIGVLIAKQFVYFPGSAVLFAILLASASYIAVPAIMQTQAKDAQEAIYLPLSLGITLPFNIIIGLPIYYYIANIVFAL